MQGRRIRFPRPLRPGYFLCLACGLRPGRRKGHGWRCEVCQRRVEKGEVPTQDDLITQAEADRARAPDPDIRGVPFRPQLATG